MPVENKEQARLSFCDRGLRSTEITGASRAASAPQGHSSIRIRSLLKALFVYAIGGLFKPGFAQTVNASNGLLNSKTYRNPGVVLCE